MATIVELPVQNFEGIVDPDWCPGCGDFGVLKAVKMGASKAGVLPKDLVVVSGIGCSSNLPGYVHSYGFTRCTAARSRWPPASSWPTPDLKVVITGGDGDGYGIGIGHFIHAMRRNLDLTYMVMDNQIYGLTTGQASPTTMKDARTKSTPNGNVELPINPLALALVSGATYIARGYSGEPNHLADLIAGGIQHKGFALIDVFSPCVTYNKLNTYAYFKKRVLQARRRQGLRSEQRQGGDGEGRGVGRPHPDWRGLQEPAAHLRGQRSGVQERPADASQSVNVDKKVFAGLIEEMM